MTLVGQHWICGGHDELVSVPSGGPPPIAASGRFDRLPSVLAIPLGEYAREMHPVMRLHRLCDSVEILTRFSFIVELGELRKRLGDNPFPEPLARALRDQIERPTLGQWKNLLQVTAEGLSRTEPLVVPELREFVLGELIPGLQGQKSDESGLIELRNKLVHGGAMTKIEAGRQLETWEPWLNKRIERLDFLANADLCYMTDGLARLLTGISPDPTTERPLAADLRLALEACDRHVVLIHQGRWVDLWPLCQFGRAERSTGKGLPKARSDSPMVYIRAERDRLLYAALGADLPHSENRDRDVVAQFQALFALKDRIKLDPGDASDFEADLRRDSASLIGRVVEIDQAVDLLKRTQSGVLWLSGKGGVGKSFFTARVAMDPHLTGDSKKVCRIAWRFQASDQNRCNRVAFFRHAVTRLEEWLHDKKDFAATRDVGPLFTQLQGLLDEAAAREAPPHPNARASRVVFVLDGLDEIARGDPDFASVPFLLTRQNVVWLCSGRPEGDLPSRFTPDRCTPVFPDGLPTMSDNDVRGMLLQGSDRLKYDLLGLDREHATGNVTNAAVEAVVTRAQGLPLYVRFVIQDLLADEHRVDALDRLPPSLNVYYDELLKRLGIGELQAILTPMVATIAWARAPLDEETLYVLTSRRKLFLDPDKGRTLIRRALDAAQAMLKLAPIPGSDRLGYEPYHPTLRDHIRTDPAGIIGQQNDLARAELRALISDWDQLPPGHPALAYILRHGPLTLLEESRWDDLAALWLDPDRGLFFHEAKVEAGMVFDLAREFSEAVRYIPADHSCLTIIRRLWQALRFDVYFIVRHPSALFQCYWNRGWWSDCPHAALYCQTPAGGWPPEGPPWERPGPRLSTLLESWRRAKELRISSFAWVRSIRPPQFPLGSPLQVILRGHDKGIYCVAFSPDGRRIVSGSDDRTIRVWDFDTGAELLRLEGHQDLVTSVAFAPDGRRIVSGSCDRTVRIWDAETGVQLAEFRGYRGIADHVSVYPDGRRVLDPDTGTVSGVAFSPGGRRIVSGLFDKSIRIWDAESGIQVAQLDGHGNKVTGVAFSRDGSRIVSSSCDRTVRIWDAESGKQLALLDAHREAVKAVVLSPDGSRVASGSQDRTVRIWDTESGAQLSQLDGHKGDVTGVAFTPDGSRIVSGSSDGTVRVWDAESGEQLALLDAHRASVWSVAIAPGGRYVVSGSLDKTIGVWDIASGPQPALLEGHDQPMPCLAIAPDGRRIASGSWDKSVRVWDAESGIQLARLVGHFEPVWDVKFSPDGRRIASGSGDRTVRIWDAEKGIQMACLREHDSQVWRVAFAPDGQRIASASYDSMIIVWDVEDGEPLARLEGHRDAVMSVAFSPDGHNIVSGGEDRTVRIWDSETGAEIHRLEGHRDRVRAVAFSPDGSRIASGSDDATVRVWDVRTGDQLSLLEGHEDLVWGVAFHHNGLIILSGSGDHGSVRVWDAENGACLRSFKGLGDIESFAAGDKEHDFEAMVRPPETVIGARSDLAEVAWFPVTFARFVSHPSVPLWVGTSSNHLVFIRLEGAVSAG
jgi:WD40 repeat protein